MKLKLLAILFWVIHFPLIDLAVAQSDGPANPSAIMDADPHSATAPWSPSLNPVKSPVSVAPVPIIVPPKPKDYQIDCPIDCSGFTDSDGAPSPPGFYTVTCRGEWETSDCVKFKCVDKRNNWTPEEIIKACNVMSTNITVHVQQCKATCECTEWRTGDFIKIPEFEFSFTTYPGQDPADGSFCTLEAQKRFKHNQFPFGDSKFISSCSMTNLSCNEADVPLIQK